MGPLSSLFYYVFQSGNGNLVVEIRFLGWTMHKHEHTLCQLAPWCFWSWIHWVNLSTSRVWLVDCDSVLTALFTFQCLPGSSCSCQLFVLFRWLGSQTPLDNVVEVDLVNTVHPHLNLFGRERKHKDGITGGNLESRTLSREKSSILRSTFSVYAGTDTRRPLSVHRVLSQSVKRREAQVLWDWLRALGLKIRTVNNMDGNWRLIWFEARDIWKVLDKLDKEKRDSIHQYILSLCRWSDSDAPEYVMRCSCTAGSQEWF